MAKQAGPFYFIGTIDDLVFYKLGDQYYVRQKSDLTPSAKKRLKNSKDAYPVMHLRQQEFGRASKLASQVYRTLPIPKRQHGLHGKLTSKAVKLLRAGVAEDLLLEQLQVHLAVLTATPAVIEKAERSETVVPLVPKIEIIEQPPATLGGSNSVASGLTTPDDTGLLLNPLTPYLLTKPAYANNKVPSEAFSRQQMALVNAGNFK